MTPPYPWWRCDFTSLPPNWLGMTLSNPSESRSWVKLASFLRLEMQSPYFEKLLVSRRGKLTTRLLIIGANVYNFVAFIYRGRYDIKMFPQFFQLHGKTFDYKIPMSTILRMFILPHKDGRQTFFVISLDPPIKQGQTRYHYLVFVFSQEDEDISIELPFSEWVN